MDLFLDTLSESYVSAPPPLLFTAEFQAPIDAYVAFYGTAHTLVFRLEEYSVQAKFMSCSVSLTAHRSVLDSCPLYCLYLHCSLHVER